MADEKDKNGSKPTGGGRGGGGRGQGSGTSAPSNREIYNQQSQASQQAASAPKDPLQKSINELLNQYRALEKTGAADLKQSVDDDLAKTRKNLLATPNMSEDARKRFEAEFAADGTGKKVPASGDAAFDKAIADTMERYRDYKAKLADASKTALNKYLGDVRQSFLFNPDIPYQVRAGLRTRFEADGLKTEAPADTINPRGPRTSPQAPPAAAASGNTVSSGARGNPGPTTYVREGKGGRLTDKPVPRAEMPVSEREKGLERIYSTLAAAPLKRFSNAKLVEGGDEAKLNKWDGSAYDASIFAGTLTLEEMKKNSSVKLAADVIKSYYGANHEWFGLGAEIDSVDAVINMVRNDSFLWGKAGEQLDSRSDEPDAVRLAKKYIRDAYAQTGWTGEGAGHYVAGQALETIATLGVGKVLKGVGLLPKLPPLLNKIPVVGKISASLGGGIPPSAAAVVESGLASTAAKTGLTEAFKIGGHEVIRATVRGTLDNIPREAVESLMRQQTENRELTFEGRTYQEKKDFSVVSLATDTVVNSATGAALFSVPGGVLKGAVSAPARAFYSDAYGAVRTTASYGVGKVRGLGTDFVMPALRTTGSTIGAGLDFVLPRGNLAAVADGRSAGFGFGSLFGRGSKSAPVVTSAGTILPDFDPGHDWFKSRVKLKFLTRSWNIPFWHTFPKTAMDMESRPVARQVVAVVDKLFGDVPQATTAKSPLYFRMKDFFQGNYSGRTEALTDKVGANSLIGKIKDLDEAVLTIVDSNKANPSGALLMSRTAINTFRTTNTPLFLGFKSEVEQLRAHVVSTYLPKAVPNTFGSVKPTGIPKTFTAAVYSGPYGKHGLAEEQGQRLVAYLDEMIDMADDLLKGANGKHGKRMLENIGKIQSGKLTTDQFRNSVTGLSRASFLALDAETRLTGMLRPDRPAAWEWREALVDTIQDGGYNTEHHTNPMLVHQVKGNTEDGWQNALRTFYRKPQIGTPDPKTGSITSVLWNPTTTANSFISKLTANTFDAGYPQTAFYLVDDLERLRQPWKTSATGPVDTAPDSVTFKKILAQDPRYGKPEEGRFTKWADDIAAHRASREQFSIGTTKSTLFNFKQWFVLNRQNLDLGAIEGYHGDFNRRYPGTNEDAFTLPANNRFWSNFIHTPAKRIGAWLLGAQKAGDTFGVEYASISPDITWNIGKEGKEGGYSLSNIGRMALRIGSVGTVKNLDIKHFWNIPTRYVGVPLLASAVAWGGFSAFAPRAAEVGRTGAYLFSSPLRVGWGAATGIDLGGVLPDSAATPAAEPVKTEEPVKPDPAADPATVDPAKPADTDAPAPPPTGKSRHRKSASLTPELNPAWMRALETKPDNSLANIFSGAQERVNKEISPTTEPGLTAEEKEKLFAENKEVLAADNSTTVSKPDDAPKLPKPEVT